jgi:hypothetical protein
LLLRRQCGARPSRCAYHFPVASGSRGRGRQKRWCP